MNVKESTSSFSTRFFQYEIISRHKTKLVLIYQQFPSEYYPPLLAKHVDCSHEPYVSVFPHITTIKDSNLEI